MQCDNQHIVVENELLAELKLVFSKGKPPWNRRPNAILIAQFTPEVRTPSLQGTFYSSQKYPEFELHLFCLMVLSAIASVSDGADCYS